MGWIFPPTGSRNVAGARRLDPPTSVIAKRGHPESFLHSSGEAVDNPGQTGPGQAGTMAKGDCPAPVDGELFLPRHVTLDPNCRHPVSVPAA